MTDNHSNPNEGIEQVVNAANYRDVPLVSMAVTQSGYYSVAGNTMTPPVITVDVQPSAQVKALIDASLDDAPVETPPVVTDPQPTDPPAVALAAGFTLAKQPGYVIEFADQSTGAVSVAVNWGSGQGGTACEPGGSVVKTYPNGSSRLITQTVTDAAGNNAVLKQQITPKLAPTDSAPVATDPPDDPVVTEPVDDGDDDPPPVEPPALPPYTGGDHTVRATSVINNVLWTAQAAVGDDPTVMGAWVKLTDPDGNVHPVLRMMAFADACNIGAMNGRSAVGCTGSLRVEYDDAVVFDQASVNFYLGTANQSIRYGKQAPWHAVDASIFPNFAKGTPKLYDLTKYDFSYNGLGVASMPGMSSGGQRGDIAPIPGWAVPFCVNPSDETFAPVRKSCDWAGAWAIYRIDDDTGLPFDVDTYPDANFLGASQQSPGWSNPIASASSGSPAKWSGSHQTGYAYTAASATGTAHDRWHATVHANAMLMDTNPSYIRKDHGWHDTSRHNAWRLRSLWFGSQVSLRPDYFAAKVDDMLTYAPTALPLGFVATLNGDPSSVKMWQDNYVHIVVGMMRAKLPKAQAYADHIKQSLSAGLLCPQHAKASDYSFKITAADGTPYTTWPDLLRGTMTQYGWDAADVDAMMNAPTLQQVWDLNAKYERQQGQPGDFTGWLDDPGSYAGLVRAATASLFDSDSPEWAVCESVPTKPPFDKGWRTNIVPRAKS
jgi:hypothetical protein